MFMAALCPLFIPRDVLCLALFLIPISFPPAWAVFSIKHKSNFTSFSLRRHCVVYNKVGGEGALPVGTSIGAGFEAG